MIDMMIKRVITFFEGMMVSVGVIFLLSLYVIFLIFYLPYVMIKHQLTKHRD